MFKTLLFAALLVLVPALAFADTLPPEDTGTGTDAGPPAATDGGCSIAPGSSGALGLGVMLVVGGLLVARRRG